MRLFPNSSEKAMRNQVVTKEVREENREGILLMPTEVIEYLYCPRFTYFLNCLNIPQHEEQRYKVLLGRELHDRRKKINREYLRRKISCTGKDVDVHMVSKKYHLRGVVDEVLSFADGTRSPFDYKFAEYTDFVYRTHRIQSICYGLLIRDWYGCEVKRGFVCYTRSNYKLKEISFMEKDFDEALGIIKNIMDIISKGFYPVKTRFRVRCVDCCYRNICV